MQASPLMDAAQFARDIEDGLSRRCGSAGAPDSRHARSVTHGDDRDRPTVAEYARIAAPAPRVMHASP